MFCRYCGAPLTDQNESCSKCGHSSRDLHGSAVDAARSTDRRVRFGIFAVIGIGLLLLLVVIASISGSKESQPAPIVQGSDYNDAPKSAAETEPPQATTTVATAPDPVSSAAAAHQQRLAALRQKQEAAALAIEIEREAINETIKRDGIEGVPEDEHQQVQRLIQQKESIDAAIKEEEAEGGAEPPAPTVVQTLAHHQMGETFTVGYWTYRCSAARWSELLGTGSSKMGRPDAAFAVIRLMMRNDDDSTSIVPPLRLVDSTGREYEASPKAVLQKDALDLTAQLGSKASADGSVIFDVPQGGTYLLKVSGGMMSNKDALIDLTLLATAHQQDAGKQEAPVAPRVDTFTGGTVWTSLATGNDWNIRQDGDYLYIDNVTPDIKDAGGFVREELKKGSDGKWRGKGHSLLPYQCGNVTNWCNDERDVEIDFLSDKRIEGFARGWEKFDCAKCKADGVKVITFTWIPK